MNLLPNEEILLKSTGGTLVLTSHRVRQDVQGTGSGHTISIMLDELASCATVRSSNVILLILAGLCVIMGVVAEVLNFRGGFVVGIVAALVLVGLYFGTRQQVLAFASAGATIRLNVIGMDKETVRAFIEEAEAAKNKRYLGSAKAV